MLIAVKVLLISHDSLIAQWTNASSEKYLYPANLSGSLRASLVLGMLPLVAVIPVFTQDWLGYNII